MKKVVSKIAMSALVLMAAYNCVYAVDTDRTDNRVYGGIGWEFGSNTPYKPYVTAGARTVKVQESDRVEGADFSVRGTFGNGLAFDSSRIVYLSGQRSLVANAGIGYSYSSKSWVVTGAAQGSYVRAGADYLLNSSELKTYFEMNTMEKPKKVGTVVLAAV